MSSPLSAETITQLRRHGPALPVEVVAETGSTNADLLARVAHLFSPLLLVAENQTAGRGRAGRTWHSAPGASLTFSLAWKFRRPARDLSGLPLATGVAIAETLAAFGIDARLKWPNDILLNGGKLAGILIELARTANGEGAWAVIGVGINVGLPAELAAQAGNAAIAPDAPPERDRLMAALLDALCVALPVFDEQGFAAFASRWNRHHAYAGRQVEITDGGRRLHEGCAQGVDEHGRLLLDTAHGSVKVTAGDVSLRLAD